ncbi:MAG: hypothetical protein ACHQ6T_09900 [Myxococcota bacterium]
MDVALQGASKAEELIPLEDPGSHYAFSKIFEAKAWGAARRNRERLKLLQSLDRALEEMLHDGERVECVAWGEEYSLLESYFLRVWAHFMNRRALLLTSERVLVLQISVRRKLLELKSQVRFAAIEKAKTTWTGLVRISPKRGKALDLARLPRPMRKAFARAVEARRQAAHVSSVATREHLCPHCYEPLAELVPACPKCRGTFKSPSRARWLSFAFPGLGDLYLGHRWLGWFQIACGFFVWSVLAGGMFDGRHGPADWAASAVTVATVLVLLHGVDAWVTGHTAQKGLYPDQRGVRAG